jgi:hypothetical protein
MLIVLPFLLLVSCTTTNPSERIFPDALFSGLYAGTGAKHWERVYGVEAITIAQQAKERYYIANGLWTEDMKKTEDDDKLMVNVFTAEEYVIVAWFSVEKYMLAKQIYYAVASHEICYSSKTGEVVSIGMGGTPLGDVFKTASGSTAEKE